MIRSFTVVAVIVTVVCLSSSVGAAVTDYWCWKINHSTLIGTDPGASNELDPLDVMMAPESSASHNAVYHENGIEGWTGPTGFYKADIRAPLDLVAGNTQKWTIHLWADSSCAPEGWMGLAWSGPVSEPVLRQIEFRLTYVRAAIGEEDARVGMSVVLNEYPDGSLWYFPVYPADNGLEGYVFDFRATVIPEPSALAALLCGLGGVLLRRRR